MKFDINMKRFTMLSRIQRKLFSLGFIIGLLMIINTVYLLFQGHIIGIGNSTLGLPVFYQIMLVLHLIIGIVLVFFVSIFVTAHVNKIIRLKKPRVWMRFSGTILISIMVFLTLSGFFILTESNSRQNIWVFMSHQILAALLLFSYIAHRILSKVNPVLYFNFNKKKKLKNIMNTNALILFCFIVLSINTEVLIADVNKSYRVEVADNSLSGTSTNEQTNEPDNGAYLTDYFSPSIHEANEDSPFFPATTTTSTGDWLPTRIITHDDLPDIKAFQEETKLKGFAPNYFLGAQSCERCHADIVDQWATSAHRFSSFNNPFYRKSIELTREKISKKNSQFCGGCHDPAIMLAGNMLNDINPLTPESQAGLTCLACHAIDKVHGVVGNGNYNIQDISESPYIFDQAKSGIKLTVHDYVLKAKPTVHKDRNLKPVFKKSEFCLTCHKVNLDKAVNNYRWLRGQNEYDAWHNSGVAHNQPKTWYEPPTIRQCQDCHMPYEKVKLGDVAADNGKVRSHRFLAANTALPALRNDVDTIKRTEAFLREKKLRLEIFAIHREDGRLEMDVHNKNIEVKPGELIQMDVVVRNLNVGHMFPGGTNDSNEGWIDFAVSSNGDKVFHNGWLGSDRHVDPAAHFYKAVLVDREGERIAKRNASDIYATVYANVIAPSTSDIARYSFRVPDDADGQTLKINARLMWRKFNREYTEFVFEGLDIPVLPITEIETDTLTVSVSDSARSSNPSVPTDDPDSWIRFNDFGIGSIMDNDSRTALAAFAKVVELKPQLMDGYLNQARVYLKEGALGKAESMLHKASEKAPNVARLAFFWGNLLEKQGRLTESEAAYRRTLQTYPESRDTLTRLGRVFWLKGEYQESIESYERVLSIDPENALAYYQMHLAYKALATKAQTDVEKIRFLSFATENKKRFEKYKIDENAAVVTRRYRERYPYDNLMSQKIIIHEEG